MARKSQHSRKISLFATMLVGAAIIAPAPASAAAARGHAAKASHHASTTSHKPASHKKARHAVKVSHHKSTVAPLVVAPTAAPAPDAAAPVYSSASSAACADGGLVPTSANVAQIRAATLCLINQQRTAAGLGQLRENAALDAAAQSHSDDMVSGNYFDHTAPSGAAQPGRGRRVRDRCRGPRPRREHRRRRRVTLDTDRNRRQLDELRPPPGEHPRPDLQADRRRHHRRAPLVPALGGSGATYTETFGTAE